MLNALTGEPLKKAQITMSKDGDSGMEHGTATERRSLHGAGSRSGPLLPECQSQRVHPGCITARAERIAARTPLSLTPWPAHS